MDDIAEHLSEEAAGRWLFTQSEPRDRIGCLRELKERVNVWIHVVGISPTAGDDDGTSADGNEGEGP